jgi:hypothetical protein
MNARTRITRTVLTTAAGGGLLALALTAAPAGAATSAHAAGPQDATAACQATPGLTCFELRPAVAANNNDFDPQSDAAATVQGPEAPYTPIFSRINANLDNGLQDMSYIGAGHVPFIPGSFWTAFDVANYGGDRIVNNQWTPFGRSSGFCMNVGVKSGNVSLQPCDGRRGEDVIIAPSAPGVSSGPLGYSFLLTERHAANLQRHGVWTAPDSGFGQIDVQAGHNTHNQLWTITP